MASRLKTVFPKASALSLAERASTAFLAFLLSNTVTPVCGSLMSLLISVTMVSNACEPSTFKKPLLLPSELIYTTAFFCNSAAWSSTHSVEPNSPGSSPSQAQYTSVLLGCQPEATNWPIAWASSSSAPNPLTGSPAPFTHASW